MIRILARILFSSTLVLFLSCAQQVSPSGGPSDIMPPTLMQTVPDLGATNVDGDADIRFFFSEWINPGTAKRSVTVYPPVDDGLRIQVSGRTLIVKPRQRLMDSTTYHVTLTTALQDLRGNDLSSSIDLYFSTGSQLDSGMVYGCMPSITPDSQKPTVALFRKDTIPLDSLFFMNPTYVTQTDSLGVYSFRHIKPGPYELLAFVDQDNNGRLNAGSNEQAFAPVFRGLTVDSTAGPFILFPASVDTNALTIQGLQTHSAQVLFAEWSDVPFMPTPSPDTIWQIVALDTPDITPPAIKTIQLLDSGKRMYLTLDAPMELVPYQLIYPAADRTDSAAFFADTIRFNGSTALDTIPPTLISSQPDSNAGLRPNIHLVWSEPVRMLSPTIELTAAGRDTVLIRTDTSGWTDTLSFTVPRALQAGTEYSGVIPVEQIIDIVGNNPVDTADTLSPSAIDLSLVTLPIDSICLMLQGGAPCLEKNNRRRWIFQPLSSQDRYFSADSSGLFRYDSIPAGKGTVAYFVDQNGDGAHTQGRLFPWRAPEPYFSFTDTIEARALWEIEGIRIEACRVCPPPGDEAGRLDDQTPGTEVPATP